MRYDVDMTALSHQTVRLARGRHASRHAGVCVMELASMLAHEPFSDRAPSISPTIGAFLRTYNDGLDEDRRQDLYSVAAAIVGTAASRAVERERITRCLAFAQQHGARSPGPRASLALATPEPAGAWAALTALKAGAHDDALSLVDALVALSTHRSRWPRVGDTARAIANRHAKTHPAREASANSRQTALSPRRHARQHQ
jgi:hypothetical protein